MRVHLAVTGLVLAMGAARAGAQCAESIRKLATDQKYDEARGEAEELVRKNSSDDTALHCVGWVLMASGNSKDALDWFERAIKINDRVSAHHLWLANALGEQAGRASKIKQPFMARRIKSEFEKASELDPASIDARHGLIQFYSVAPGVMGGSMEKAREQAAEIAKRNGMRGHLEVGGLLEREKDVAGAEREFTAAVTVAPDSNVAYNRLATFYARQKRFLDVVAVYDRLLTIKPDAINARLNIAWNLVQAGKQIDRAEREVKEWLAKQPKDASVPTQSLAHFALGRIYEQQGRKDAAKAEYQTAVTINPRNEDAKKALASAK